MVTDAVLPFGVLLSRYRAAMGLTQEELAERAGLSARAIGDLERAVKTRPRGYTVRQLAEALQLSPDDRETFERAARAASLASPEEAMPFVSGLLGAPPANGLVGREEERGRIRSALDSALESRGRLLLFSGDVGAGKTRLLQETVLEARDRRFIVLAGWCSLVEQSSPYYPILGALRPLTRLVPAGARAETERAWKRLQRLASEVVTGETVNGNGLAHRQEMAGAVTDLVLRVTRTTPVALLIDDLQWADSESLLLLHHLARAAVSAPLLLAATVCEAELGEQTSPLAITLVDLGRERLSERVTVRRLSLEETTWLVEAAMVHGETSEEFASFVYRRTKGNPRLIDHLIRSLGGRLELQGEIGAGSMGRVFRALDHSSGSVVAAKLVLARSPIELTALLRWQHEGAVLTQLKHPNIVAIHGTFAEEHATCIIMELVDGQSLGQILLDGPLPLHRARHLALQVVDALAYAHAQSIVHQDIKPDNIMVLPDDRIKVTDFGIARLLQPDRSVETVATTGMRMGTPLYMAPEQIEGKRIDGRADVYALGAVLYHMVTGRPPFDESDALAVIVSHLHREPVPPGSIDPSVPAEWGSLILKALAKEPAARFGSAGELRAALQSLPERGSASRAPVRGDTSSSTWRAIRRLPHLWLVAAGAIAAIAIAAIAIAMLVLAMSRPHASTGKSAASTRIDAYLQSLARQQQFSGVAFVSRGRGTVLSQGYGLADRAAHEANTPATTFPVPGVSYTMSLAAGLRLEEQGRLSDSASICAYLLRCPGTWKDFTIHAVLTGTAHLPVVDRGLLTNRSPSQALAACEAAPVPAALPQITEFDNCTVLVLGMIFQRETGQSWETVLRETVLHPARMVSSGRVTDELPLHGRALDYADNAPDRRLHFDDYFQLYSTARDVASYDRALFDGRIVSKRSVQRLLTRGPAAPPPDVLVTNVHQGYRWQIGTVFGRQVIYTVDTIYGFAAANLYFPQDGVTVVLLSNESQDDVPAIAVHVASLLFGSSGRAQPAPRPRVVEVSPGTAILARVDTPAGMGAGAFLDGYLWSPVADTGKMYRINATTDRLVATLTYGKQETVNPQQNPNGATVANGQLWATDRGGQAVVRLGPRTGRVMKRVALGIHGQNLAGANGILWISSYDDDAVVGLDLTTDRVVARVSKLGRPTAIAAGDGAVWVPVKDAPTLIRIDPRTGRIVATVPVGTDPQAVAVGDGAVWVSNGNGNEVFRVDPANNRVVARIPLDSSAGARTDQSCDCANVAVNGRSVWAIAHDEHQLLRIDPGTNRIVARLTVPPPPGQAGLVLWDVLEGEGSLWLDAAPHSIFRVALRSMPS